MRILLVHNYYQQPGGEDRSFEAERDLLREAGHEVFCYTRHNDDVQDQGGLATAVQTLWNRRTYREVRELIRQQRPDVMHCTNTFPLISAAVYAAARAAGVPVVQALRNYRSFCVNGLLYRDHQVCQACVRRAFAWPGIRHGCYRDSRLGSAVVATNNLVRRWTGTWRKQVDLFFTPTEFARQQHIAAGFDGQRIAVKPNFLAPDPGPGPGAGQYALFIGRLSPEKGIDTLLDAWRQLPMGLGLKLAGDGPLRSRVEQAAATEPSIEWLGQQTPSQVLRLLADATCLVLPSHVFETFGRVVVEGFACGTPAIVSNHGALPELVRPGENGQLFRPGDAQELARQVALLAGDPQLQQRLRTGARASYLQRYTAAANLEMLLGLYDRARQLAGSRALARTASQEPPELHSGD